MANDHDHSSLDEDASRVLELAKASGRLPYEQLGVETSREQLRARTGLMQLDPEPVAAVLDLNAAGPVETIPLRLYRGIDATSISPALVFFHGGGWVIGDLDTHDVLCRALANAAACRVISVHYRRAPENKFPAAVEDSIAATAWIAANAAQLQIDPACLLVGGDSSGANLAAVVALDARDHARFVIAAQVLIYPALDMTMKTESHRLHRRDVLLTHRTMTWFREQYLSRVDNIDDWRASPGKAASFNALPPAFVITAGFDPLCDEGIDYVESLRRAGVAVQHRHYGGQMHGFLTMSRFIAAAQNAIAEVGLYLKTTSDKQRAD